MINQAIGTIWKPDELESVTCDLCGSKEFATLYQRPDAMIVSECVGCGLALLNPRPKPEFVEKLYNEAYFAQGTGNMLCGYPDYLAEESRWAMLESARTRLAALKGLWAPTACRCLEIGCATGEFCHLLSQRGAKAIGLDLSDFAIQTAQRRYPSVTFMTGGIENTSFDGVFDALFGFELIEHVLSPQAFFLNANRLLRPSGMLILSTPNLACGRKVGYERWLGFHASFEHLYFLAPDTIEGYAARTGFELISWKTGCGNGIRNPPPPKAPRPAKDLLIAGLRRTRLLNLARRMRSAFRSYDNIYRERGEDHNLLVVMQKKGNP